MTTADMHREPAGVYRRHGHEAAAAAHEHLARLLDAARGDREGVPG